MIQAQHSLSTVNPTINFLSCPQHSLHPPSSPLSRARQPSGGYSSSRRPAPRVHPSAPVADARAPYCKRCPVFSSAQPLSPPSFSHRSRFNCFAVQTSILPPRLGRILFFPTPRFRTHLPHSCAVRVRAHCIASAIIDTMPSELDRP